MCKLFCWLGLHPWVYWDDKKRTYQVCPHCKVEHYTRPGFYLWHRLDQGMLFYRDPDWILKQPDSYQIVEGCRTMDIHSSTRLRVTRNDVWRLDGPCKATKCYKELFLTTYN